MALVHTVVLKPRAVIADAFRRFRQRPGPLWAAGAVAALPALMVKPAPTPDFDNLEAIAAQMPSMQDLQTQLAQGTKMAIVGGVLSALAWPVITLLTQGVAVQDLLGLATHRLWVAAKAFGAALIGLCVLSLTMLSPAIVLFVLSHPAHTPWELPGIEAAGFWLLAVMDSVLTLLVVSLLLGALMVVPAEACVRPAPPREVLTRSWAMCRAYLFPITGLLTWLGGLYLVAGFVTDAFDAFGGVGRIASWGIQGAVATIAPLCGASLHQSFSEHAATQAMTDVPHV